MSHELEVEGNIAKMAYCEEHGLPWWVTRDLDGTRIPRGISTAKFLIAASLDHLVRAKPIYYQADDGTYLPIPEGQAAVRTDGKVVGVNGSRFEIRQAGETVDTFDPLIQEGKVEWSAGGNLRNGRLIWGCAKVVQPFAVHRYKGGTEDFAGYLTAIGAFDGSMNETCVRTLVRGVCANTTVRALDSASERYQLRHTAGIHARAERAAKLFNAGLSDIQSEVDLMERLDSIAMQEAEFQSFGKQWLDEIMGPPEKVVEKLAQADTTRQRNACFRAMDERDDAVDQLLSNFREGHGNRGESRYDALNSVTEFLDHQRKRHYRAKSAATKALREIESQLLGDVRHSKERAVALLTR